jgi:catechol 2,3-dioxygenase-like lactoylglutathione lyase family enzyme
VRLHSFSHTGITVSDFNRAVRFYWDVFGCPLVGVSDVVPARLQSFFKVAGDQPTCKIGWLRVPGGAVLEIFEFRPDQPPTKVAWNRAGLTHLCFNIRNAKKWHDYLVTKGVEIVSIPERSPNGGQWFFFVKDCDGNLIELTQLGVTNDFLLRWLGPFGGWLAQRGMVRDYRRYYQPKRDDPP